MKNTVNKIQLFVVFFACVLLCQGCITLPTAGQKKVKKISKIPPLQQKVREGIAGSCASEFVCADHFVISERLREARIEACQNDGHSWSPKSCLQNGAVAKCEYLIHHNSGVKQVNWFYPHTPSELLSSCQAPHPSIQVNFYKISS